MANDRDDDFFSIVDPLRRGIIPLTGLHISRRLRRTVRQDVFSIRVDSAFAEAVALCADAAPDRPETWISHDIESLYSQLHAMGAAHSVECWREGALVGGLYGVSLGGAFFGESMFSRARDASKIALVHLCARLIAGSYALLDTQFLTAHLARFGAIEISRERYHARLRRALAQTGNFTALPADTTGRQALNVLDTAH